MNRAVNEVLAARVSEKPALISHQARELLNLRRLALSIHPQLPKRQRAGAPQDADTRFNRFMPPRRSKNL